MRNYFAAAVVFFLASGPASALADKVVRSQVISGSDDATITISLTTEQLNLQYQAPGLNASSSVYIALGTHRDIGSAVIPFERDQEGSTVFLPFKADRLLFSKLSSPEIAPLERQWTEWKWREGIPSTASRIRIQNNIVSFQIPRSELTIGANVDCAIYAKDLSQSDGWGRFFGCNDPTVEAGPGDRYISTYLELDLSSKDNIAVPRARLGGPKLRVYQLFVRLFGNTNETRKHDGTLAENGVGKFTDINDTALKSLRDLGITHIWLTGVLQQATATDYSAIGQPADDPDLLKGLAGSPYAIKDYFDVCPDYANDPKKRLDEFKALIGRIHGHGLKALIDFVPNHVARSYNSDAKPDQNFGSKGRAGTGDDPSVFFSPQNNFFYLKPDGSGPPLKLPTVKDGQPVSPTCKVLAGLSQGVAISRSPTEVNSATGKSPLLACDGFYDGEKDHGKVTGNNKASWTPGIDDWYETVKLNYGFDFTNPNKSIREYPNANAPEKPIPDTWQKMDSVIAFWQAMGVDGFRCDMSHMVPPEFWNFAISRARSRHRDVVFLGEAYDNDPAKVPGSDPIISQLNHGKSNVMFDLLNAGFNGVYDDPTYRAIKKIYEGPAWANDIDDARPDAFIFENSLRYAENHDEVRLAAKSQWGGVGMRVGIPVSAILYGLSRGPVMIYNGQEVGEPGEGLEGFGSNDARTSIFDYWSIPELVKWVNGHKYDGGRLTDDQRQLRSFYGRLLNLVNEPAFRDGICLPLNPANRDNTRYGRLKDEQASGHWLYSFLRFDPKSGQRFLAVVNLNPTTALKDVTVRLPDSALKSLGLNSKSSQSEMSVTDRLNLPPLADGRLNLGYLKDAGIPISELPPLTACYLEIKASP